MVDDDAGGPGRGARSLKTAASVLRALRLLGGHPEGLTSEELGAHLGKSAATARYMINTLCDAGCAERGEGARWRLADTPPWGAWAPAGAAGPGAGADPGPGAEPADPVPEGVLSEALTALYHRTRQRSYLVRRRGGVAVVVDTRGHQGLARLPGLGDEVPPERAHALAWTKVLLAAAPVAEVPVRSRGDLLARRREIEAVRRRGVAVDDGEWAAGFASVAAPVVSPFGDVTTALGISVSRRRWATDGDELVTAVTEVAAAAAEQWVATLGGRRPEDGIPEARGPVGGAPVGESRVGGARLGGGPAPAVSAPRR